MPEKFYQFDYAVMNGSNIDRMGILNIRMSATISKKLLIEITRQHLNIPTGSIIISNVTKLTKKEFEEIPT